MPIPSTLRLAADSENLARLRRFVAERAAALCARPAAIDDMVLAVDEMATNIIVHGYQGQDGTIEVRVWREGSRLAVRLRDQAPPFDPATAPRPNLALTLEQRRPGGLGIHMSQELTDAIIHRVTPDGGNELTLFKQAF
jgi:serine/threonine-protein kinase RsbW